MGHAHPAVQTYAHRRVLRTVIDSQATVSTQIPQAQIFAFNPPAINGVGSFGGFQFEIEDRGNVGLGQARCDGLRRSWARPRRTRGLQNVFTQLPHELAADRGRTSIATRPRRSAFRSATSSTRWRWISAPLYVNNFTYLNRSWQVNVQADEPYRNRVASLGSQYVYVGQDVVARPRTALHAGRAERP